MEEKSFEDLLKEEEQKRFDRTVTGTVIGISSKGEIFVDFGYKADGIIPKAEYSEDDTKNPKDEFNEGDSITADVLKWNDGTGNVLLSYKKLKRREQAIKEKEARIERAKQREIEKQKRKEEKVQRTKNIEEFWNNLKVGDTFNGTISKIADYGMFVDLGLVKGLLHISEVLWDKSEKLEDTFKVGDEIEVKIKSFDKDEKRISLEYPQKPENPWFTLVEKYKVNDIVTCKIVKFAQFGAFVEIEKGLEGLVHNSEITSLKRVVKPEDELKLGQMVNVKIINIDKEKCKISLSIKELEGTSAEYGYEDFINNK